MKKYLAQLVVLLLFSIMILLPGCKTNEEVVEDKEKEIEDLKKWYADKEKKSGQYQQWITCHINAVKYSHVAYREETDKPHSSA